MPKVIDQFAEKSGFSREASREDRAESEEQEEFRPPRPRRNLRVGFSTGSAATAAAQGALRELLGLPCFGQEKIRLPQGGSLTIPLWSHGRHGSRGEAVVVKDGGDDPDATHGAEIGARVWFSKVGFQEPVIIRGGEGVGRVTKPGLPVPVGEPAVNPVPRRMVHEGLASVWREHALDLPMHLLVEIFVPRGEEIARYTLNPRLGILGGISILGTTGLVRPFSHEAYRATIAAALKVARAVGLTCVVLATGGKSEEHLRSHLPHLPEEAFVQMGDYVRFALRAAVGFGFTDLTVGAFFGKAVKIAQGFSHTHASRGVASFRELALWTQEQTGDPLLAQAVSRANTAREVLEMLPAPQQRAVVKEVGSRMLAALRVHAGPGPQLTAMLLDFDGHPLFWEAGPGGSP